VIGLTQKALNKNAGLDNRSPKRNSSPILFILTIFYLNLFPLVSALASDKQTLTTDRTGAETPWRITADKITYEKKENIYTAVGNVLIQKEDKTLSADTVQFNRDSMDALAEGNVVIKVNQDQLSGDRVEMNLNTNTGVIEKGKIFIEKNHYLLTGDRIEKTGQSTYYIKQGTLTTCDGDSPDWRITAQDIDVTLEGYGTSTHTTFWTKNIPVLYSPYFAFPVKIRRQSGLLAPQIGYSKRDGAEYDQPLYWAINRSSDATFYFHPIQNRGEQIGGEYRYSLDPSSKGTIMMDGLDDQKIDDGKGDNSDDWGYTGDKALRTNHDRYWFRMKADQSLPFDSRANLDLDVVSDQDYLRSFSHGFLGYNETKNYFESEFDRDIDDKNDYIRRNNLNINKIWTVYSFTTDVTWNDNVIARQENLNDPTLQQLPDLRFNGIKQPGFNNLFYTSMESEYTYFYRQYGQTGHRENLYPRLYLPYHYNNYFAFEPSIGFLQTYWYVDEKGRKKPPIDAHQNREMYDIECDLSTDISKIFDINGESVDKIKHTISPKLEYGYIPKLDQSDFPKFDEIDDIPAENVITFSLTNLLITKDKLESTLPEAAPGEGSSGDGTPDKDSSGDGNSGAKDLTKPDQNIYHQILRFLIEQPYDFNKAKETEESPYDPLYAELELMPSDYVELGTETKWSYQESRVISSSVYSQLSDIRQDYLRIEHLYSQDRNQSIYLYCIGVLTKSISLYGEYERNLKDGEDISKTLGGIYTAPCWSVNLGWEHEDNDTRIGFMIRLTGLTEAGKPLKPLK
jgi:LPS-assembly protein